MKHKKEMKHEKHHSKEGGFDTGHAEHIGRHDHGGMPREVVMKEYPKSKQLAGGHLNDTMTDIDQTNMHSEGMRSKYVSHQK